jgi:hypothetical protein
MSHGINGRRDIGIFFEDKRDAVAQCGLSEWFEALSGVNIGNKKFVCGINVHPVKENMV